MYPAVGIHLCCDAAMFGIKASTFCISYGDSMKHEQQGSTMDIGPQYDGDSAFLRQCRLQQSNYRATVLQQPCGVGPACNSNARYGNMLINGDISGSNFVSEAAFRYAQQRARDKVICNDLTLDEFRLFNNMLSSMPLCFNMFSDLRTLLLTDEHACTKAIKALFRELDWIDSVLYIGVEFIPVPTENYIDDKTAFDALIIVANSRGQRGVIAVETKYTDLLGTNTSRKNGKKNELVRQAKLFHPTRAEELSQLGYTQLYRNFLLTYAYARRHKMVNWANVTISPREDHRSKQEIDELVASLTVDGQNLHKIDLDDFFRRGLLSGVTEIVEVFQKLQARYAP
jgi:hypothetical protein